MPVTNQTLNNNLYDNLYAQGYSPDPLDSMGKESQIKDADIFRLNYKNDNAEGQVWMAVVDGALTVWLDNNFTRTKEFEKFNKFWKNWSQQQTLRWEITNRDRLISDMKKRTDMKNQENQLNEGYYALGKQRSYSDSIPTVKLILQHTRQLEEGEQRFRNIAKIFVENAGGERFLLPTNRPGLARVFARHIAEGGTPYDDKGRHITNLVEDYTKMAGFVRATRKGQFNESALKLVNEGLIHYNSLRMTLQGMTSHRGYNKYFENYIPLLNEEIDDDITLNELFVQEVLDPRIENVMPILKRLSRNLNEITEVKELEEWAESITEIKDDVEEGGYGYEKKEDETTKTLAEPASDMLDEIGIAKLKSGEFLASDRIKKFKQEIDKLKSSNGDPADIAKYEKAVKHYEDLLKKMKGYPSKMQAKIDAKKLSAIMPAKMRNVAEAPGAETLKHNQDTEKSNLKAFDLGEGFSPSQEVADQIVDSLGGESDLNSDDIYRAVDEYQTMMDSPHKLDTDEIAQIVMDRLKITNDDIDETLNELSPETKKAYAAAAKQDKEFNTKGMNQALHRAATDQAPGRAEWEDEAEFFKSVNAKRDRGLKRAGAEVDEGLDADQKAAGQLGPTEKVGPKGAVGKLVGANENHELDNMKRLAGLF